MKIVYSHQRETLDALIYRHFGNTAGLLEQVLELNPHLAEFSILPTHTAVKLPEFETNQPLLNSGVIQLWN